MIVATNQTHLNLVAVGLPRPSGSSQASNGTPVARHCAQLPSFSSIEGICFVTNRDEDDVGSRLRKSDRQPIQVFQIKHTQTDRSNGRCFPLQQPAYAEPANQRIQRRNADELERYWLYVFVYNEGQTRCAFRILHFMS